MIENTVKFQRTTLRFKGKLYCPFCKKYQSLLRNRVTILVYEHPDMLGGICRKCHGVTFGRYPMIQANCGKIKARVEQMNLRQFREKHWNEALPEEIIVGQQKELVEDNCKKIKDWCMQNDDSPIATPQDFLTESEADIYLRYKAGTTALLRKNKMSPPYYRIEGEYYYWIEELQDHIKKRGWH
jgi:hypothetical protein